MVYKIWCMCACNTYFTEKIKREKKTKINRIYDWFTEILEVRIETERIVLF